MYPTPELRLVRSPTDAADFHLWIVGLHPTLPVGLDTETDGLGRARDQTLRTVQLGDTHHGWVLPADEYRGHIRHALDLLRARGNPIAIHNAMFDLDVLETAGLPIPYRHQIYDTMLLALHENNVRPAGLKDLCKDELAPHLWALDRKLDEVYRKSKWTWATIPLDHPVYWRYAAYDPVGCARVLHGQLSRPHPAYPDDLTFNEILRRAYRRGILVDQDYRTPALDHLEILRQRHADQLETDYGLTDLAAKDIGTRLEAVLGVPLPRTKTGEVSTSKDAIGGIDHPACELLLTWRRARNEASKVRDWLNTDRVRPVLRPWALAEGSDKARPGRASTIDPNLSAFTGADKGPLRNCLIPDEGHRFVSIDYSNQELRLIAHFTRDIELTRAFAEGIDIHDHVANLIGIPRPTAKTLNFALPYGARPDKLAATVGCTLNEMMRHLQNLDAVFPGLSRFVSSHEGRSWETIGGRTVHPDPDRPYTAGNYRIQGSGADVLKTAVARLEAAGFEDNIVATVHDEVLFTFPEAEAEEGGECAARVMHRDDTDPPLPVDVSPPVARWGEAK